MNELEALHLLEKAVREQARSSKPAPHFAQPSDYSGLVQSLQDALRRLDVVRA